MEQYDMPALVEADPNANATDLLIERVKETPDLRPVRRARPATAAGATSPLRSSSRQVRALAKGFIAAGIEPGDKVGLMCKTRYEWSLIDFAMWFAGAVLVPIYETSSPAQVLWNLRDSGAVGIIVETPEPLRPVRRGASGSSPHPRTCGRSTSATSTSSSHRARTSPMTRWSVAAASRWAPTWPRSSTRRARPAGRRAACSPTRNFVELCRNARLAIPEVVQPGSSTLLFVTTRAHLRTVHLQVLCVHGGVKVGHQADTKQLLPAHGELQADLPARGAPRVREGVQLLGAEGGSRREGQDLPRGGRGRDRALQGAWTPARSRSA